MFRMKWKDPIEKEIDSLSENNVWELVHLPEGKWVVGSKGVFKHKIRADGSMERYKACLMPQGCSPKYHDDYDETLSLLVHFKSVRTVLSLVVFWYIKWI